jgi:Na+/H+ antiporter NhaD/arsenite permease-like protein
MLIAVMDMGAPPPVWLLAPFLLLIAAIAVGPLLIPRIWERRYPIISLTSALVVVGYYLLIKKNSAPLLATLEEYISFITLIGSLFIVSGGIRISVAGASTPIRNVGFLALGALLANLLGTTGAAMLLIRPWIRMNRYRITGHHIVFFIFIIANVGGCLTPIGDPPLFLGYLRGVPFLWTLQHLWGAWLFVVAMILAVFYFFDRSNFNRAPIDIQKKETEHESFQIEGWRNLVFLGFILAAVIIRGCGVPWFVSDGMMIVSALASHRLTSPSIRKTNEFTFEPLKEVAWLFLGIFTTLVPVIHLLNASSHNAGHLSHLQYYWMTGALSSFLDNAPTYLTFLTLALNLHEPALHLFNQSEVARFSVENPANLVAISLGAVFFGAATYIGNGPNLMIKSIAESSKIHMPSFFGYILRFTLPILIPILGLAGWIFIL